ncbi:MULTISPECIES: FAD-dependent monooxygenase [unclassified Streptomyces]|uniref:FAD-dependent monooxygenase n=1 Tax=unclassified Streptomyces TaxID=2593676 RepID=UPI0006F3F83F|nr:MULTISPECIES: FAD-dependent monooxygenase [unclassified Streptomyces]KQX56220.1 monooxygenase [Streptomyces sp. Root1304]KRA97036.1 monooxygenase [Streptomyces sp. Root66D1]
MSASTHPVLIAGAGPAGLAAALALRAAGLPAVVLERRTEESVRPGSRAAYLHGASLRELERLSPGLGHEVAGRGIMWATKRSYWGGKEIYARTYPPVGRAGLPPFTSLPQVITEDLMAAACRRQGVEFHRGVEVTSARSTPDGVLLTDSTGREWSADYVIAADGSRSALRSAIGSPLEGPRSQNTFVVVDLDDDPEHHPMPIERVFHYRHPGVGGRNVLTVPFAGGWRVDLNLLVNDDPARYVSPEGLRHWIPRILPEAYGERVRWVSTYRFAQQVAAHFTDTHRRVLLTGEAAHLFAPFGARGMNSSIPDAVRAVEAVAQALEAGRDARAAGAAVTRFAEERKEAATYNRACASAALEHMLARHPALWLRQRAAAAVADAGRRAGEWLDSAPYGPKLAAKGAARGSY